jgi:hypothetical protein
VKRGHVGGDKSYELVSQRYAGIPKVVVKEFVRFCAICCCKQIQHSQPRIKPIRSDDFWSRIQIDLIDMRHNKCVEY